MYKRNYLNRKIVFLNLYNISKTKAYREKIMILYTAI